MKQKSFSFRLILVALKTAAFFNIKIVRNIGKMWNNFLEKKWSEKMTKGKLMLCVCLWKIVFFFLFCWGTHQRGHKTSPFFRICMVSAAMVIGQEWNFSLKSRDLWTVLSFFCKTMELESHVSSFFDLKKTLLIEMIKIPYLESKVKHWYPTVWQP